MNKFENWYTSILEEVATAPTNTLVGDVDTIISSLGTLVKELTEELNGPEFNELNEADAEGPSKVWQWIWWMPKARKAQQKVNKIKLNITDMEGASADAPDAEQKAKITAKAKQAKEQASELQKMVDDKYGAKGELVKRVLGTEKIAGQIASIKRATGLEDNPERIASYKEKMAELQAKYKEDQAAIKELEPSEDDIAAEKTRKKEEAEAQAKLNKDAEAAKKGKSEKDDTEATDDKTPPATDDKTPAETPEEKEAREKKEKEAVETPEEKEAREKKEKEDADAQKIEALNTAISGLETKLKDAEAAEPKDEEAIKTLKSEIETKKGELDALKPSESLVNRANAAGLNELATEIGSKFSWQVAEGTVLHQKYDAIIKKAEYSNTLNESRYQNLSVKDKFSKLL